MLLATAVICGIHVNFAHVGIFHCWSQQLGSQPASATCTSPIRTYRLTFYTHSSKTGPNTTALSQTHQGWCSLVPVLWEVHKSQPSAKLCACCRPSPPLHLTLLATRWSDSRSQCVLAQLRQQQSSESLLKHFILLKSECQLARSTSLSSLCLPHLDRSVKLKCIAFNCKQKKMDGTTTEY